MNLVYKHTSGGTLWQSDRKGLEALGQGGQEGGSDAGQDPFDPKKLFLVVCAEELDAPAKFATMPGVEGFKLPLFDCIISDPDQALLRKALKPVVEAIVKALERGKKVQVHCNMGLNRSGLVVGLTLRRLGVPGEAAVALIRKARGHFALTNASFYQMVLK